MMNFTQADNTKSTAFKLTNENAWLLWCCQFLTLSTLAFELSVWMILIITLCLGWQVLLIRKRAANNSTNKKQKTIPPIALMLIALCGCIGIALSANNFGVLKSMIHLITFAFTLKAFEVKQRKDFYQLLLLGFFVLASALIFKQTFIFSFYIITILMINLTVLHKVFVPQKKVFTAFKTTGVLLLQSTFLAITLFIVFPRLAPFWQVPNANSAKTGLSGEVSPGDIASLALSSELAFRVDFKGKTIPSYSSLYWRAMTLENFDGTKWTRAETDSHKVSVQSVNTGFSPNTVGEGMLYDVIVEPSYQSWLFGLAVATSNDPRLMIMRDYTIKSRKTLSQTMHYQVNSYLHSPKELNPSQYNKQRNLALVKGSNPKLEQLGAQLKKQYDKPVERAQAILDVFKQDNYFYTLNAPILTNNSLDQFYFDTKAGFCEHYASSFTYLMRAAGIPARVVTGYLGGEYNDVNVKSTPSATQSENPQGGHLSVYQYDAHAWSEIWLEDIGWQRVDPTAAVDPQRVESGWSNDLLTQQLSLNNDLISLYQFKNIPLLNKIRLQLDALDYQWTRWVLGYSSKQQYEYLKRLLGDNISWKVIAIVSFVFIFVIVLMTLLYRTDLTIFKRQKITPWLVLYQKLTKRLASKGLDKALDMTPQDFALIVTRNLPELSKEFRDFTTTFENLSYGKLNDDERKQQLSRLKNQYKSIEKSLSLLK